MSITLQFYSNKTVNLQLTIGDGQLGIGKYGKVSNKNQDQGRHVMSFETADVVIKEPYSMDLDGRIKVVIFTHSVLSLYEE